MKKAKAVRANIVAYVDPINRGVVRFVDGADSFDGILAGTRAQMVVDALNFYAAHARVEIREVRR